MTDMDYIKAFVEFCDGERGAMPTASAPHGKMIQVTQTAFHDICEYEDGHVERYYIGD